MSNADVQSTGTWVGGLVGINYDEGSITDAYTTGDVTSSTDYAGGLVGQNRGAIDNTYASGDVTGSSSIGGLVGRHLVGTITNSFALGRVTATGVNPGGLVGESGMPLYDAVTGTIANSYWSSITTGQNFCYGDNPATGGETDCTNQADPMDYYDADNPPMADWDFSSGEGYWESWGNALPVTQSLGPTAYYRFDTSGEGYVFDSGSYGAPDGTLGAGAFLDGEEMPLLNSNTSSLYLNGLSHYVDMGDVENFYLPEPFTISAMARIQSPQQSMVIGQRTFDGESWETFNYGISFDLEPGKYGFLAQNAMGDDPSTFLETPVWDHDWHMITWTYDGTTLKGYLDGTLDVSEELDFQLNLGDSTFFVGAGSPDEGFFSGNVDDVRIYQRALDAEEISQINHLVHYVRTCEDLQDVRDDLFGLYKQLENIDCGEVGFEPIGDEDYPFEGSYDGDGHMIDNLTISYTSEDYNGAGLFGTIGEDGSVGNVGITSGSIEASSTPAGGIVGINYGTIHDVFSYADVSGLSDVGGIAGQNLGEIENVYARGDVSCSNALCGGVIGYFDGTVSNAYAAGDVTGGIDVGGLIGRLDGGTVDNVFAVGHVAADTGNGSGGLIGDYNVGTLTNGSWSIATTGQASCGTETGCDDGSFALTDYTDATNEPLATMLEEGDWWMPGGLLPELGWQAPESYYRFDEASVDRGFTDNATDLTFNGEGSETYDTESPPLSSLLYNAASTVLNASSGQYYHAETFNGVVPTSHLTVCSWVKTESNTEVIVQLGRSGDDADNEFAFTIKDNGHLNFWDYYAEYGFTIPFFDADQESDSAVNDGEWHHVCFVKNGTSGMYVVDGQEDGTVTAAIDATYSSNDLVVGVDIRDSSQYYTGNIDDLRVYNRSLSVGEIALMIGVVEESPDPELIGHWSLDSDGEGGRVIDSSDTENDGQIVGSVIVMTEEAAPFDPDSSASFIFDGVSDHVVTIPHDEAYNVEHITVSAWVKLADTSQTNGAGILCKGDGGGGEVWCLDIYEGNYRFYSNDGEMSGSVQATSGISTEWTHVVGTYDGNYRRMYINGKLDAEAAEAGALNFNSHDISIGCRQPSSTNYDLCVNGLIDDVHIYDDAMTDEEIYDLTYYGVLGYWPFDEGEGTTANDATGYGFDATLAPLGDEPLWNTLSPPPTVYENNSFLVFDGSNYVTTERSDIITDWDAFTVSAWVNVDTYGNQKAIFSNYDIDEGGILIETGTNSNDVLIAVNDGVSNPHGFTNGGVYNTAEWHLWTVVYDGAGMSNEDKLKFYIDGVQQALSFSVSAIPAEISPSTRELTFGTSLDEDRYLIGSIDDIQLFEDPLGEQDVVWLAQNVEVEETIEVDSCGDLQDVSEDLSGNYIQTKNIDCNGFEFEPIGFSGMSFDGEYDGDGHVISNLEIDFDGETAVGLFGAIGEDGHVYDLGIVNGSVHSPNQTVGGFVGENYGHIENCFSRADVSGDGTVGGFAGFNDGLIENSYATGNVESTNDTNGGFVGDNDGIVGNAYASGSVDGYGPIGGFFGLNTGLIDSVFAVGGVETTEGAYGLGYNDGGAIVNSIWNSELTGQDLCGADEGCTDDTTIFDYGNNEVEPLTELFESGEWFIQENDYPILMWEAPVAYYPFDGYDDPLIALDESYFENDLNLLPSEDAPFYDGESTAPLDHLFFNIQSIALNGIPQYMQREMFNGLPEDGLTICTWLMTPYGDQIIAQQGISDGEDNDDFFQFRINGGGELFFTDYNGEEVGFAPEGQESDASVNDGEWHHVCFVKEELDGTYYIDGEESGTVEASTYVEYDLEDFVIGGAYQSEPSGFDGNFDDFRYYARALSAPEIAAVGGFEYEAEGGMCSVAVHWNFDEGEGSFVEDSAGNSDGEIVSGEISVTWSSDAPELAAENPYSLQFTEEGQGIGFSKNTEDEFTVSMWIKPETGPLVEEGSATLVGEFPNTALFYEYTDETGGHMTYPGEEESIFNDTLITAGEWHHIALVNDHGNATFYLDGVEDGSFAGAPFLDFNVVGGVPEIGTTFNGSIDELNMFDVALTAGQIATLAEGDEVECSSGGACSLEAYWTFDEGEGSAVADDSGNGHDGTLTGDEGDSPDFSADVPEVEFSDPYSLLFDKDLHQRVDFEAETVTDSFTLAAWIKIDELSSSYTGIITDNNEMGLLVDPEEDEEEVVHYYLDYYDGNTDYTSEAELLPDTWYHVAVVNDNGEIALYIDGENAPLQNDYDPSELSELELDTIGSEGSGYFDGNIDDVRIYDGALSSDQILDLAGGTEVVECSEENSCDADTYWSFDTVDGISVPDDSGGGVDGEANDSDGFSDDVPSIGIENTLSLSQNYVTFEPRSVGEQFSTSFWVKTDEFTGEYGLLLAGGSEMGFYLVGETLGEDAYKILYYNGSEGLSEQLSATALSTGEWHHIALVNDGEDATLYIDGEEDEGTSMTGIPVEAEMAFSIIGDSSFANFIDDVRIYDRLLSADDVLSIATGELSCSEPEPEPELVCPPFADGADASIVYGESCYAYFDTPNDWSGAEAACNAAEGGHLASIADSDENAVVNDLSEDESTTWLGGKDDVEEGMFVWMYLDELFSFTNWSDGEPNDGGGVQDCVQMYASGLWDDAECNGATPYVCEMPAVSAEEGGACTELEAYWTFDEGEGAPDSTSNGHDGTLQTDGESYPQFSADVPDVDFGNDLSMEFTDVTQNQRVEMSVSVSTGYTLSLWLKVPEEGIDGENSYATLINVDNDVGLYYMTNAAGEGANALNFWNGDDQFSDTALTTGAWHHVAVVNDDDEATFYIDGESAGTVSATEGSVTFDRIGGDSSGNSFMGNIDDVRIFSAALSADQIMELSGGAAQCTDPTVDGYTWTGDDSTDWFDDDNWSGNTVPDEDSDVIIAESENIPTLSDDASIGSLTIEEGALFDTNGYDLTFANMDTFTNEGTLAIDGDEELTNFTNDTSNGGTIMYKGNGEYSLTAGTEYANLTFNDGLIGYWKFDDGEGEIIADSSGYGNDGERVGDDVFIDGEGTPGLNFYDPSGIVMNGEGVDSYVSIPDSSILNIGQRSFTTSAWVRPYYTQTQVILAKGNGDGPNAEYGFLFGLWDSEGMHPAIYFATSENEWANVWSNVTIGDDSWHHIAVTVDRDDPSHSAVFIDGERTSTTVSNFEDHTGPIENDLSLSIGAESDGQYNWRGQLDDVRLYNYVLPHYAISALADGNEPATDGGGYFLAEESMNVRGDLILNSGTFALAEGVAPFVRGSWINNGGVFEQNNGMVVLEGESESDDHVLQTGGQAFENLQIMGENGLWVLHDDLIVHNTLDFTEDTTSTIETNDGNFEIFTKYITDATEDSIDWNGGALILQTTENTDIDMGETIPSYLSLEATYEPGLIGYWKMDEGQGSFAYDVSGNEYHGLRSGTGMYWNGGGGLESQFWDSDSMKFNGSNDVVSTELSLNDLTDFTISAVVNAVDTDIAGFVGQNGAIEFGIAEGSLYCWTENGGQVSWTPGEDEFFGSWERIACTGDGEELTLYVNGDIVATGGMSFEGNYGDSDYYVKIGGYVFSQEGTDFFEGAIDDVRIYDTNLSSEEIENLSDGRYARGGEDESPTFTLQDVLDVAGISLVSGNLQLNDYDLTTQYGLYLYAGNGQILDGEGAIILNSDLGLYGSQIGNINAFMVNGNVYLYDGLFLGPNELYVTGDWYSENEIFYPGEGAVYFTGGNQTLTGDTTFWDFTKNAEESATLFFNAGDSFEFQNSLSLHGTGDGDLSLVSNGEGAAPWYIAADGENSLSYLFVQNSINNGESEIECLDNCEDGEGNERWIFGDSGPAVCGNAEVEDEEQCDDGNTHNGDGCTFDCSVEADDGWECSGEPSICTRACSESVVAGSENAAQLGGMCYAKFDQEGGYDWETAKTLCEEQGGTLAIVDNDSIQSVVNDFGSHKWIGLSDLEEEDFFEWVTGQFLYFNNWHDTQPNGGTEENCALMEESGDWHDYPCSEGYAYACEFVVPGNDNVCSPATYWTFNEEDADDASGSHFDGSGYETLPSVSTDVPSGIGFADSHSYSFNGANQAISVERPMQNDFTICSWIKATGASEEDEHWRLMTIVGMEVGGVANDFGFGVNSAGKLSFGNGDGTDDVTLAGETTVNTGEWMHVCATREQVTGHIALYVNGTLDGEADASRSQLDDAENMIIGLGTDGGTYWDGNIDDLRIYNAVLSAEDIETLATGSVSCEEDDEDEEEPEPEPEPQPQQDSNSGGGGGGGGGGRSYKGTTTTSTSSEGSESTNAEPRREHLSVEKDGKKQLFRDVWTDDWFAKYIDAVVKRNIFSGYQDVNGKALGLYGPSDPITLGQLAKVAMLLAETPVSGNTTGDEWFVPYMDAVKLSKLSVFLATLDPLVPATRGQVIQTILEALDIPITETKLPYSDVPANSPYAQAIATATKLGIVSGDDPSPSSGQVTTFRPNDPINRAEVAKMIIEAWKVLP